MPDRVSVGRIIFGHGDGRRVIDAGTRFNTDNIGLDARDVARMEQRGVLRRPRDDIRVATTAIGPGGAIEEEGVEERRSGGASNVRSPAAQEQMAEDNATGDVSGAAGADTGNGGAARSGARRGKTSDLDL